MGLSKAEKSHSAKSILNCERVLKPNFVQALCKRTLAVSGDMCKRSPISRLVYPKHASAATPCSRAVRDSQIFQSLSLETYWVRPAANRSGINSSTGRLSCLASVVSVVCRLSLISYVREPAFGRKPIRNKRRSRIDMCEIIVEQVFFSQAE